MDTLKADYRINTRIIDSEGEHIAFNTSDTSYGIEQRIFKISIGNNTIGEVKYSFEPRCCWIHRMDNYTVNSNIQKLRHVGTALFEFVFKQSLYYGREGRVELFSIEMGGPAYFKMGFRKKNSPAILLERSLDLYYKNPTNETKNAIITSEYYRELETAAFLNKQSSHSFDNIIEYGSYDPFNHNIAELIKSRNHFTISDAYCDLRLVGTVMYLPEDQIKKIKNCFLNFCPIGSNITFTKEYAFKVLKSDILKDLIETDQIDPSNAVELEAKINIKTKEFNLLTSKIGLEMLRRNYISCWYVGVYFNYESAEKLLSQNTLNSFKNGTIKNIGQIIHNRVKL
jgi:hypothetical protein